MRSVLSLVPLALCATAYAEEAKREFAIITGTSLTVPKITDTAGVSSLLNKVINVAIELQSEKGDAWAQSQADAQEAAYEYMSTVTNVDIPDIAKATDEITIYNSVPTWYTALPSNVRVHYDGQAEVYKKLFGAESAASSLGVKAAAGVIAVGLAGIALL